MDNFLIPLFFVLAAIIFYPVLMLYVALTLGIGVFTWLVFAVMLSPYVALWYYVEKKRMLSYIKLLLDNKPYEWNVEETLEEYQRLLRKQKAKETKSQNQR